ncbi:MAG: 30S ribosome-binding factor RbfA [Candidatus Eisenbacteria bacterium]|nr:30S ribosome-binding factor RbfA [Candidatus Eisenbacteria bacterium]
MTSKRVLRVAEAMRRELGFILDRKLGDPKIGMVTITRLEVSDDLRHAKVYVSFLGGLGGSDSLKRLRHAGRFLRGELAHTLNLRVVPRLAFILDESAENYIRIAEVLKAIEQEEGGSDGPDEAEEGLEGED